MIKQLGLWIQVLLYYFGSVVFDTIEVLEVQFLKTIPSIFLIFAILIKLYRERRKLMKKLLKSQKKYVVANVLTIVNIYFIIVLNNVQEGLLIISVLESLNFFLKTVYHSLLCLPKMTTKLEYGFSIFSLTTYLIKNTFDIYVCIFFGESDNAHQMVLIRIKTEIGLAYLISLLAQFTFIVDLQTRAIRQKIQQLEQNQQERQKEQQSDDAQSALNQHNLQIQKISKQLKQFKQFKNVIDQGFKVRSMKTKTKIILAISLLSFFIASTLMNLLFITIEVVNLSTTFVLFQGLFLLIAIFSKGLLERRHLRAVFFRSQRNFVVSYFLAFVNIYWFYKLTIAASFSDGIAIAVGINYFLKMFYYSLLSCSKSTSRIQLLISLITSIYYIFNYSHAIVATIYENQPIDSDFFIRVKTQIGIALMTSLTAQYTLIMDIQMDAIKQYRQKENNIQNIIKNDKINKLKRRKLQIQMIRYEVFMIQRENKQNLLQKCKDQKMQKYLLDLQVNEEQRQIQREKIDNLQKQISQLNKKNQSLLIGKKKLAKNYQANQNQTVNQQEQEQEQQCVNCNLKGCLKYFNFRSNKNKLDKILCLTAVNAYFLQAVVVNIVEQTVQSPDGTPYYWIYHIEQSLCLVFLVSKYWLLVRKNHQHFFAKAQKQYFLVYLIEILLIYLLLVDIKISVPTLATLLSVHDYIVTISGNLYISFLCIPQTTSRIQFVAVFISLIYSFCWTAFQTAHVIIYFQAYQEYFIFRRFLYMTLAVLTLSLSITCLQMDYLIKAIRQHGNKFNQASQNDALIF